MRRILSAVSLIVALVPVMALAHHGPITVKIDAAAKKQPAVVFPHEKHTKLGKSCDTCHHTQKGLTTEKDTKVETCTSCHLDPKKANVPSMREMSMSKNPFHDACVGCHKEQKKGPTACKDCHVKK